MKKLILAAAMLFSIQGLALSSVDSQSGEKIDLAQLIHGSHSHAIRLDSICHSNNDSYYDAQRTCNEYVNLLALLSNDHLVLSGSCRQANYHDNFCRYAYGYILEVQAISVGHH